MSRLMKWWGLSLICLGVSFQVSWGQTCWEIDSSSQAINLTKLRNYSDHLEMSGEQMSFVLRWKIDDEGDFCSERSLVFPMLRTLPDDTHASLMHRSALDVASLVSVDGLSLHHEQVETLSLDGMLRYRSTYSVGKANVGAMKAQNPIPEIRMEAIIFPSTAQPMMLEKYVLENISSRPHHIYIPEFYHQVRTPDEMGREGAYIISTDLWGSGTFLLGPHEKIEFFCSFQAYCANEEKRVPDVSVELNNRLSLLESFDSSLVLKTPDPVIDREFRFSKIRAAESIFKTEGGYMHAPGGESYYAAIWANDQAEYVSPFFPFLGYDIGNASSINCYRHFARFMNEEYRPIPSSIIAEGRDIWDGAGDRGDAAMIAHGAARYAMARSSREEALELWPLITWCLEYCRRQLNESGVVRSDTDELENRFPAGDANLSTSSLYYDALLSAAYLAEDLGGSVCRKQARTYRRQASVLAGNIERHFGAEMEGFHTYRYYEGNDRLRSWICLPLIVGLEERSEGTVAALTSPYLMTEDGILTEQGSDTFWDRSTLYALRGIYISGDTEKATSFLHQYSHRRLLETHVPYPIEAYPEGSQRHLSAESGLYCRVVTEGMFGIHPMGLKKFGLSPRLPEEWNEMQLCHIKAFGADFDIKVERIAGKRLKIFISNHDTGKENIYFSETGEKLVIDLV